MRENWNAATRESFMHAVVMPDGIVPPYFVTAPTDVELQKAMTAIGWLRTSAYGPFVASDGHRIAIAFNRITLRQREEEHRASMIRGVEEKGRPHGTLFVLWPNEKLKIPEFHKDRHKMIDAAIKDKNWIVRDLPTRD